MYLLQCNCYASNSVDVNDIFISTKATQEHIHTHYLKANDTSIINSRSFPTGNVQVASAKSVSSGSVRTVNQRLVGLMLHGVFQK